MHLNPAQQQAVDFGTGQAIVLAVPGAGKTRVIVNRVAKLVERGVPPHSITLMTFTRKAAEEMRRRLEDLIGDDAEKVWAGTFHSWAYHLLRAELRGPWKEFVVVEDPRILLRKVMAELGYKLDVTDVARNIMLAQQRLLTPDQYAEIVEADLMKAQIAEVYRLYQRRKHEEHKLDYGDMVPTAIQVLEDQRVLASVKMRCQHLLLDEYHDVAHDQIELMLRLAGRNGNLMVVADPDQSIFSFRGSDVRYVEAFKTWYPRAQTITLGQNYRSTPQILEPALALIRHNAGRIDKPLETANPDGRPVEVCWCRDQEDEAATVTRGIIELAPRQWGHCAILYRTNAQSLAIESALFEAEIPFTVTGGKPFFELSEVKLMLGYLRMARNPLDDAAFRMTFNTPPRYLGAEAISVIQEAATERGLHLYQAISVVRFPRRYQHDKANEYILLIDQLRRLARSGPGAVLAEVRRAGVDAWLQAEADDVPDNERRRNVEELCRVAGRWADTGKFLSHVVAVGQASKGRGKRVQLMTLHRSKGLEFPNVFLVGAVENICPHQKATWYPGGEEEERRLFYVGMTRAQKNLTITVPGRVFGREMEVSRFIGEAGLLHEEVAR